MQKNGFYAAMKTDEGVQAIYIDEETFRTQQHRKEENAARRRKAAARHKEQRATIKVLKQELKLIGMGAVLYWGYTADLVALAFMVPVLAAFQTVICFRAGRWYGRRDRMSK